MQTRLLAPCGNVITVTYTGDPSPKLYRNVDEDEKRDFVEYC